MGLIKINNQDLQHWLRHYFDLKKTVSEAHRILSETYSEESSSEKTCGKWFQLFHSGDFCVEDKQRLGQPKKFEDAELQALLDENPFQTLPELTKKLKLLHCVFLNVYMLWKKFKRKENQSDFFAWQRATTCCENCKRNTLEAGMGSSSVPNLFSRLSVDARRARRPLLQLWRSSKLGGWMVCFDGHSVVSSRD